MFQPGTTTPIKPVATKSVTPDTIVAQSNAGVTFTLGVRNNPSSTTDVSSLTVADTSADTWDDFDLVSVGPVTAFPDGADQVAVTVHLANGDTVTGDPQPFAHSDFFRQPDGSTALTITNTFPAPRLVITKRVKGQGQGPYAVRVTCTQDGVAVPGYPRTVTFAGPGTVSRTDIPVGAVCTAPRPRTGERRVRRSPIRMVITCRSVPTWTP